MVREVVMGIQARGSVRLSEIARALDETVAMKKVIERLGRHLNRPELRERAFRFYAVADGIQHALFGRTRPVRPPKPPPPSPNLSLFPDPA